MKKFNINTKCIKCGTDIADCKYIKHYVPGRIIEWKSQTPLANMSFYKQLQVETDEWLKDVLS